MKYALSAVLLAACTDPAAQMTLELPTSTTQVDLSCVSAVDLMPIATGTRDSLDIGFTEDLDAQAQVSCVDLDTQPQTLEDVEAQIRGKFEFAIPPNGFAGVEMRGRSGNCKTIPAYFDSIFYGAGDYSKGQQSLPVKVAHNLSCDKSSSFTAHAIDMVALLTAKTCVSVDGTIFDGNIRPTLLGGSLSPIVFEDGITFANTTGGVAMVQSFSASFSGTCPAVGWVDATASNQTATCIDTAAPTACSTAGQLEIPTIPAAMWSAAQANAGQYAGTVFGGVWSASAKAPITGATVTLDANSDATVVYGTLTENGFTPNSGATSTDASGAFVVYTNQVVGLTVTAAGGASSHLYTGADAFAPVANLVVLN